MSQGITTPASDGLWSLLSYWRKAKSQLDWEIPTYMSVHGNVQPVMGKSKCGGSEDTWTLQLECCADEGVICHLSSTVGKDSGKLLRHESSIIYRDGEANLLSVECHQLPPLPSRLVPHVRHPPTYLLDTSCLQYRRINMEILLSLFPPTEWAWDHTCSPDIAKRPNDISLQQNKWKPGIWAPDLQSDSERDQIPWLKVLSSREPHCLKVG